MIGSSLGNYDTMSAFTSSFAGTTAKGATGLGPTTAVPGLSEKAKLRRVGSTNLAFHKKSSSSMLIPNEPSATNAWASSYATIGRAARMASEDLTAGSQHFGKGLSSLSSSSLAKLGS